MKKLFYLAFLCGAFILTGCNPDDSNNPTEPNEPSSGYVAKAFSVSDSKQVLFSPGNLQYHPEKNEWRFAPKQYSYAGNDNENINSNYDGWIDLFGWGTGDNPTNSSKWDSDYENFVDWGTNKIGKDVSGCWRTLTYSEWNYLIFGRSNCSSLYGIAQVAGVNGLILLPDNWQAPKGVVFKSGVHNEAGEKYYADYQKINATIWKKMENAGAIFLPACDARVGKFTSGAQYKGYYWASTMDHEMVWCLAFASFYVDLPECTVKPSDGLSVRLVKDL